MAYSSIDDLKKKIDEIKLIQLTDIGGSGRVDSVKVESAIAEADALIDSYVSRVYQTPLGPVPNIVVDISATIAIGNLHRFRCVESLVWTKAYENAILFLKKVAGGAVTLEGAVTEPSPSGNASSAGFSSADRRFSRETLKGM
ncbi:hypothetical protein MNBD_NITROSPINAE02-507 [hydrothermal vent metagenome]|uniref:DUF1320 domain-containing protein n=1 Tax=hydrothermal vent metagenome TaxID=652676 RepID=A0A3B1CAV0_9ZZZZ